MIKTDWSTYMIALVVIILFFIVLAFSAYAEDVIEGDLSDLDIYVSDGDTFRIKNPEALSGTLNIAKYMNDKDQLEIRIQGIDAPEKKQVCYRMNGERFDCAGDATRALAGLLSDGTLYCVKAGTSYDRVVMRCSVDNKSVGARMVSQGHAFFDPNPRYTKGVYRLQLSTAEGQAKINGIGVWQQPEVVKPWDWRKTH